MVQSSKTDYGGDILIPSKPEHFLGLSSDRYFSSGFKHTEHSVCNFRNENEILYAELAISWPETWAKKNGLRQKPHFGTLDFFLYSARLAEYYLISNYQLSTNNMWITEFSFKAGNICVELEATSASCKQLSSTSTGNHTLYLFEIVINNAIIHLKISMPENRSKNPHSQQIALQNAYYSTGYILYLISAYHRIKEDLSFQFREYLIPCTARKPCHIFKVYFGVFVE